MSRLENLMKACEATVLAQAGLDGELTDRERALVWAAFQEGVMHETVMGSRIAAKAGYGAWISPAACDMIGFGRLAPNEKGHDG